jgi:chromatin structure-remodeling complex subunit RSC9
MVLSLRSGISNEVEWALCRLVSLSKDHVDRFILQTLPGLTDALFEWPEWYIKRTQSQQATASLFALSSDMDRKRKHAIESLLTLRNSSLNERNASSLFYNRRLLPLLSSMTKLPLTDYNAEFIYYAIEILISVATQIRLPSRSSGIQMLPLDTMEDLAANSSDRSLIMASLTALQLVFSIPSNQGYIRTKNSPALAASIRFLPLVEDLGLITASIDYIHTHLSYLPALKAFLVTPEMPSLVRLLVAVIKAEQRDEYRSVMVGPPLQSMDWDSIRESYQPSEDELTKLTAVAEPDRSFEWLVVVIPSIELGAEHVPYRMKTFFVHFPGAELTQLDFWTSYKDTFTPFAETYPLLPAPDVIKNVTIAFPQAQAMVIAGTPQRFVIQNIKRREKPDTDKYKCRWGRDTCPSEAFQTTEDLYAHLFSHLVSSEPLPCTWGSCNFPASDVLTTLRPHLLTHLPARNPPPKHPSQPPFMSLSSQNYPHQSSNPTSRPPPPAPEISVSYPVVTTPPSSISLTALLILRMLFPPKSINLVPDENRFGFPMLPSTKAKEEVVKLDSEGERKGRKAFEMVQSLLADLRLGDEALMGWIAEMVGELDAVDE